MRDYVEMENNYKAMQTENYTLREYVINLQSRLLDAQGEFPQPPPNLILHAPPQSANAPDPGQTSASTPGANSLEVDVSVATLLREHAHVGS